MNRLFDMLSEAWDSLLGRFAILAGVLGWVPFVLLSHAYTAMRAHQ